MSSWLVFPAGFSSVHFPIRAKWYALWWEGEQISGTTFSQQSRAADTDNPSCPADYFKREITFLDFSIKLLQTTINNIKPSDINYVLTVSWFVFFSQLAQCKTGMGVICKLHLLVHEKDKLLLVRVRTFSCGIYLAAFTSKGISLQNRPPVTYFRCSENEASRWTPIQEAARKHALYSNWESR